MINNAQPMVTWTISHGWRIVSVDGNSVIINNDGLPGNASLTAHIESGISGSCNYDNEYKSVTFLGT